MVRDLQSIYRQLTEGVQPESGRATVDRVKAAGMGVREVPGRVNEKLGVLAEVWQAPSTKKGTSAISAARSTWMRWEHRPEMIGNAFSDYLGQVGNAKARVPEPQPLDEVVSVIPAGGTALRHHIAELMGPAARCNSFKPCGRNRTRG
jgi:hypothetical protein